jgi:serine/threonine-protein phosphatase 4 regulatory subunit 1
LTTIASYLHELAKILTPEQVAEDLLPVYTRLVDSPEGIRERVLEHVDEFMAGLPDELAWMTFLGLDKAWELDTLGQWRTREAVALHLPAFFKLFVKQDRDISPILSITLAALLDKFAAVRDAAIKSIPESYSTLNDTKFDGPFREMILGLATAPEYRRRVTFTRCLREFIKPPPNREAFEEFFIPALPKLRHDVIDVRIALAQIVADLFEVKSYYHDEPNVPVAITQLVRELAEDESRDVRETVRDINLDKIGKGKGPDVEEKSKFHSQPRPTEHSSYLTPRPPVKATDSDATPQPTAAEAELARQPDPFDSSFEHAIHKDNN